MKSENLKRMTIISMLCAAAFIAVFFVRIPVMPAVPFLKYEPKDVIIVIGGFIYGPLAAFLVSMIVSVLEFITISDTGIIGLVMNIISTCAFACTASAIYKLRRTMSGAIGGLVCGVLVMTALMLLWNYLVTPLYMNIDRAVVQGMLIPAFLPFNLIKGVLNMAFTLFLYKPVITALRKSGALSGTAVRVGNKTSVVVGTAFLAISLLALYIVSR